MMLRLAEGAYEIYGIPPMRRPWRSLFAERQVVAGDPGAQNVHTDDLRWQIDSFAGGEGQSFMRLGEDESERRFLQSSWIDHSEPGRLRLGKQMLQKGLTGGATVTTQGNASGWSGGTVVNSDDRRIDTPGTGISRQTGSLSSGTYQFDIYAYMTPPGTLTHPMNTFFGSLGSPGFDGTSWQMSNIAQVQKDGVNPADGTTQVTVGLGFVAGRPGWYIQSSIFIYRDDGLAVAERHFYATTPTVQAFDLTFNAEAGRTYSYRVQSNTSLGAVLYFNVWIEQNLAPHGLVWGIRRVSDSVIVASGGLHLNAVTTKGVRIASATISHAVPTNYQLEFTWSEGQAHNIVIDKYIYSGIGIDDPRTVELGMDDSIWLTDFEASSPPNLLYWNEATQQWIAIGAVGTNGQYITHMAHTKAYEYILNANSGFVWRSTKTPGSQVQYTQILSEGRAIAAAANRLYGLAFSGPGFGVRLFEVSLDVTSGLPLAWSVPLYQATTADLQTEPYRPQQMASLPNGVVFFLNVGPDCVVHAWNAGSQTGVPIAEMPRGFVGEAIVHGSGYTFIGGSFPARDAAGTLRRNPALFMIDHLIGATAIQQVDVKLAREHDVGGTIRGMQLYGSDLYLQTQVDADMDHPNGHFHIWRLSLKDPGGMFCDQDVTLDQTQSAEQGRGLALNHKTRVAIWGKGPPYIEGADYRHEGELITSRTHFGATETKMLLYLDVVGDFPGNTDTTTVTSVELLCGPDDLDEEDWESCGIWTRPEARLISLPLAMTKFKYLRLKILLKTTDVTQTPTVYAIEARGTLAEFDRIWELFIRADDESATNRITNRQVPGSVVTDYIYALATAGNVAEFEDFYTHKRPEDSQRYYVTVEGPEYIAITKGEGAIRVRLTERGVVT